MSGDKIVVKGYVKSDVVEARHIDVVGVILSTQIIAEDLNIMGFIKSSEVKAKNIVIKGFIDANSIDSLQLIVHGRILGDRIRATETILELTGISKLKRIESSKTIIKSIVQDKSRGRLQVDEVYSRDLSIEFTNARIVACCKCRVGEGNRIERFFYGDIIDVDPSTIFMLKPIILKTLCNEREAFEYILPTSLSS